MVSLLRLFALLVCLAGTIAAQQLDDDVVYFVENPDGRVYTRGTNLLQQSLGMGYKKGEKRSMRDRLRALKDSSSRTAVRDVLFG